MSEFWLRKIRTFFARVDLDKDGMIRQKDFEKMIGQFCETEIANAEMAERMRNVAIDLFRAFYAGTTDGVLKGDEVLTEDIMIESMKPIRHNPEFAILLRRICPYMFELMDVNKDGVIQKDEHRRFFEGLGCDALIAKAAFPAIDTNGDGVLSFDEFMTGFFEFCSPRMKAIFTHCSGEPWSKTKAESN